MAYFPIIRFATLVISAGVLLSGCCANNVCDCQDAQADAIQLRFSRAAGSTGFAPADLDTIIIQRYPKKFTATTKPEVVTLLRTAAQLRDSIILNNTSPFAQTGSAKLSQYRYVVQYPTQTPGNKPVATTALVIDSVLLRGSFDGTGCCTCYTNTEKKVYLNGRPTGEEIKENPVVVITK